MERPINMTVKELKEIVNQCPDDMLVIIPVIDEEDCNSIFGFRMVRTVGILYDALSPEEEQRVLCLNGAADGLDINSQIKKSGCAVKCEKVLY